MRGVIVSRDLSLELAANAELVSLKNAIKKSVEGKLEEEMNNEILGYGVHNRMVDEEILKLTSKGYSTREAKRKIERDNKKRSKKLNKRWNPA